MQKWISSSILLICTHIVLNGQYCIDNRFTEMEYFTDDEIIIQNNIPYGFADDWYAGIPQPALNSFNIAYPNPSIDELVQRPLIVLAHGGGFWGGEKESFDDLIREFAKKGFVAASVNYRKGWDAYGDPMYCNGDGASLYEAIYLAMQDVQACNRYLTYHASAFGIDTSWIFIGGESAGIYALLNSIYISQEEWNSLYPTHEPDFGPINSEVNGLEDKYTIKGIINMWGGIYDTMYLNEGIIHPIISFYGTSDDIVPPSSGTFQNCENYAQIFGSESLNKFYDEHGVYNALHRREGYGHDCYEHTYVAGNAACFMRSLFCENYSNYEVNYQVANCSAVVNSIDEHIYGALELYPNPASDVVTMVTGENISTIEIYNSVGQKMNFPLTRSGNLISINTSSAFNGIYFIRAGAERGEFVIRK